MKIIRQCLIIGFLLIGFKPSLAGIDSMNVVVEINTIKAHIYFSNIPSFLPPPISDTVGIVVTPNDIEIGIGFTFGGLIIPPPLNWDTVIVINKLPGCYTFNLKCLLYFREFGCIMTFYPKYEVVDSTERVFESINQPLQLFNPLPDEIPLCEFEKQSKRLDAGSDFVSYDWQPGGEHSQSITIDSIGKYVISVTDTNGCFGKDSVVIKDVCPFTCFTPNTFTPNGDGLNETFQPICDYISEMKLYIYSRWGALIYYSEGINSKWNGKINGNGLNAQEGIYAYKIVTKDLYGEEHSRIDQVYLK